MSKYKNKKVVVDGYNFDSKAEARYYEKLRDSGESFSSLSNEYWEMQKSIAVLPGYTLPNGRKVLPIKYKADFVKYRDGEIVKVVDVKGYQDNTSKLKMKMFSYVYRYEVVFAKYDRKTDTFEEMSCFESLKLQNQRAKLRREKKKEAKSK
ncbi:hypothetical protein ABT59_10385 [Enterococcus cecorum]|uniref:DUF1064 domain-containing protein n=1 Tax=Enterococcus cecorum TaxID=44008 RepID=UPI000641036B|nr:DUF1064 domain-containing protein [Enterococcus cecorum]KLN91517.1 hypothetical protein ABT59_10385 [Enterococcus cecorum]KLN92434.1 hypothetical protein ABT60_08200 [Enterococcus cecorum]